MGARTRAVEYTSSNFVVNRCNEAVLENTPEMGLQFERMIRQVQDPNIFDNPTANIMNVAHLFSDDLKFLKTELESRYEIRDGTTTKLNVPVQMNGKENVITTYTLQWIVTQHCGVAVINYQGTTRTIPYVVQKEVSLELGTSETECVMK